MLYGFRFSLIFRAIQPHIFRLKRIVKKIWSCKLAFYIVYPTVIYNYFREQEVRFYFNDNEHTGINKYMSLFISMYNKLQITVRSSDLYPGTTLNEYLRDKMHLTATKKMCLEGGCGVCVVTVETLDASGEKKYISINSVNLSLSNIYFHFIHFLFSLIFFILFIFC